jgi:hypothetical protein
MNTNFNKFIMNLRSRIISLINKIFNRELDPQRVERIYREFDINRGYGHYHNICQKRFSRKKLISLNSLLQEQGFEYVTILSRAQSLDLIQSIQASHPVSFIKKDTKNLAGYHLSDRNLIKKILSLILTNDVDKRLISFFKSEYLIHWLIFSVTPQAEEQASVSFRWHCDSGPTAHLKLIVYLNSTEEHGGNTEFITLTETKDVAANGYLFGWNKARSSDIRYLSKIAGHEIHSHQKKMNAGEGVLFQPSTVLHRGVSPTLGARYAITLCLLPSPIHWQQALECHTLSDLATDEPWHHNAGRLLHVIELNHKH